MYGLLIVTGGQSAFRRAQRARQPAAGARTRVIQYSEILVMYNVDNRYVLDLPIHIELFNVGNWYEIDQIHFSVYLGQHALFCNGYIFSFIIENMLCVQGKHTIISTFSNCIGQYFEFF